VAHRRPVALLDTTGPNRRIWRRWPAPAEDRVTATVVEERLSSSRRLRLWVGVESCAASPSACAAQSQASQGTRVQFTNCESISGSNCPENTAPLTPSTFVTQRRRINAPP
jgi:hypothetical protein